MLSLVFVFLSVISFLKPLSAASPAVHSIPYKTMMTLALKTAYYVLTKCFRVTVVFSIAALINIYEIRGIKRYNYYHELPQRNDIMKIMHADNSYYLLLTNASETISTKS